MHWQVVNLTVATICGLECLVLISVILQRVSGFGFGILSLPVLTIVVGTNSGIAIMQELAIVVGLTGAWSYRTNDTLSWLRRMALPTTLGVGSGLVIMRILNNRGLEFCIGAVVLLGAVGILLPFKMLAHERESRALPVVGYLCGALTMATGLGGPPLAVFAYKQQWPPEAIRGTFFIYFSCLTIVTFAFRVASARVGIADVTTAAVLIPAVGTGHLVALFVVRSLGKSWGRAVATVVVFASGASAMVHASGVIGSVR